MIRSPRLRWFVAGAALVSFAVVRSDAQFGFGGVVLDPTQSAHAVTQIANEGKSLANQATQIAQGSEANMTLGQQLATNVQLAATATKDYMQAVTLYNTVYANLRYFNSKAIWQTVQNQLTLANFANKYGETAGLQAALGGSPSTSGAAWRTLNTLLAATSTGFWQNEIVGSSNRLATLARIEAIDGVATHCLAAVGTYNAARTANVGAVTSLQDTEADDSNGTNTEIEQLNLINAANAQSMNERQGQGQLQACMAEQAAIGNLQQRTAATQDLNTWAFVQEQRAYSSAMPSGGSRTWTTYLP